MAAKGVYRALAQGVMGEPLGYAADTYDAAIVAGVFTPGHAPPSSFDELIRVVRSGGYILFSLRDDVMPEGFAEKMRALTEAGLWRLVRKGERFQSAPKGEPHVRHRMWIYQVV
jgi:SAM-dependent methyltransferase